MRGSGLGLFDVGRNTSALKFVVTHVAAVISLLALSALATADSSSPEFPAAIAGATELARACEHDLRNLWDIPLCGRLILVAPTTRQALLTQQDPELQFVKQDKFFVGTLPKNIVLANTSVRWNSQDWAMVLLPLPENRFSRLKLLIHESFHRVQGGWNLSSSDPINDHLDTEHGRLWMRLELRALARALRDSGSAARQNAADAALFRAYRNSLFADSDRRESALEIHEGLAEYTGAVIAMRETGEVVDRIARQIESAEDGTSFVRSFAYATGPALGLLLDRYDEGWRKTILETRSLSARLATKIGLPPRNEWARQAGSRALSYGYRAVAAEERDKAALRQAQLAGFQKLFRWAAVALPESRGIAASLQPE